MLPRGSEAPLLHGRLWFTKPWGRGGGDTEVTFPSQAHQMAPGEAGLKTGRDLSGMATGFLG